MPKESKSLRLNRDTLSKMAQQIKEKLNNSVGVKREEIEVSGGSENDDEPLAVLASRAKRRRSTSTKPTRSSFAARMADRLQNQMQAAAQDIAADIDCDDSRVREPFASADTCVDSSVVTLVSPVPMTTVFETETLTYSNRRRRASSVSDDEDEDRNTRKNGRQSSPT